MIGGGVTVVFVLLFYSCTLLDDRSGGFLCLPLLFFSPMSPFIDLFDSNPYFHALPFYSMEIMSILVWFIIGAFIGAIIKHIKKSSPK